MLRHGAVEQGVRGHAAVFPVCSVLGEFCWCGAGRNGARVRPMKTLSGESVSGTQLIEQLPHPNTKRWVVRRKAAVVAAVRGGGITIEEACRVYQLSREELLSWDRAFELHGLAGLRATRIQQYNRSRSKDAPPRLTETRDHAYDGATK
jgi:transposase-like protein